MANNENSFQISLSLENLAEESTKDFISASGRFLDELRAIRDLEADIPRQQQSGTRGFVELLSGIVILGSKVGAFKALYRLARDLFDSYHNAEVVLTFRDGSTLKLKGLSQAEAEILIEKHLALSSSPIDR